MTELQLHETTGSERVTLAVRGTLTRHTVGRLRDTLTPHLGRTVHLDLAHCTELDLDGALALAVAYESTTTRGGRLVLDHVPPPIEEYLRSHTMAHLLGE